MNCKCVIVKDRLCNTFVKLIKDLKYYIILFLIFFIIAFITGFLTASKYSSGLSYSNFINEKIVEFLKKEKSTLSLFLSYYFWILLLSLFTICFTKNLFLNILEIISFMLYSYIIGFDLCVFIYSFGIIGFVFGVFIYAVLMILTMLTYLFILAIATKILKNKSVCIGKGNIKDIRKTYFLLLLLQCFILFLLCILFSILHIFVIID